MLVKIHGAWNVEDAVEAGVDMIELNFVSTSLLLFSLGLSAAVLTSGRVTMERRRGPKMSGGSPCMCIHYVPHSKPSINHS